MKKLLTIVYLFIMLLVPAISFAQEEKSGVGELMRSNGRIYVVVAVMLTILAGLIFYLVRLDRKITKLEKESH